MKLCFIKKATAFIVLLITMVFAVKAQDYVSPVKPAETGKSLGVKVKLLSTGGGAKTYTLIFATGDEVVSGLTEFAQKYNVKSAHYTAIGDAASAKVGWYDASRNMFKVIPIDSAAEVTSLVGDIAVFNGKPVAHSHVAVATEDGIVHGGHLLQLFVGPTLEVFVTVESNPLYKKLDNASGAGVIDPSLEQ